MERTKFKIKIEGDRMREETNVRSPSVFLQLGSHKHCYYKRFDTSLLERETTSIFARRNSGKILFIFHKSRWQNIFTNRAVILVIFVFEFLNMKADSNFMDYKVIICILYPGNIQNIIICN